MSAVLLDSRSAEAWPPEESRSSRELNSGPTTRLASFRLIIPDEAVLFPSSEQLAFTLRAVA